MVAALKGLLGIAMFTALAVGCSENPSEVNSLKLAVFQVGNPDSPFVVPVEE